MGLDIHNIGSTSFDVKYTGLEHTFSTSSGYDYARFECSNGDSKTLYPPTTSSSTTIGDVTFSGLSEGESYYVDIIISFDGVEYDKGSDSATTLPEEPVNVHLEDNIDNIYVDWYSSDGADEYQVFWYKDGSFDGSVGGLTSTNYTIDNVEIGSEYEVIVESCNDSSGCVAANSETITIEDPKLDTPSNLHIDDVNEGGIDIDWHGVSGEDHYWVEVERIYDNYTKTYMTTSTYLDLSAGELQYGVNYGIRVRASSPDGSQYDSDWTSQIEQITRAKQPTLTVNSSTSTSITIGVSGLEDNYYRAYVNLYNAGGGSSPQSYVQDAYVTTNHDAVKFSGLSTDTTYEVRGRTWFSSTDDGLQSDYSPILEVSTDARPENFAGWSTNVTSGATYNILASDWNSFTSKINEFQVYEGNSETSFTTVSKGDDFLASYFTNARNAIANMSHTGTLPSTKTKGDNVNASDLNNIVTCLNSIP